VPKYKKPDPFIQLIVDTVTGDTRNFELIKDSYHLSPHLKALFGNITVLLPKGAD